MSEVAPEGVRAVTMPKWGLSMTEGTIGDWHVQIGDQISKGSEVVDIETSKIANVMESTVEGQLRKIIAEGGQTLPCGALLAVVSDEGVSDADVEAFTEEFLANFDPEEAAAAAAGPQPEDIEINGKRMRYLKMAPEDFEGGVPALFIHGFGGDLNNFLFNMQALAEERAVYSVDLPGHGESEKDVGDGSLDHLKAQVIGFIKAMDFELVNLIGHSMGGAVATAVASALGEDVINSVTLLNPAGAGADVNSAYIEGFIGARKRKDLKPVAELLFADKSLVNRDMLEDLIRFKRLDGVGNALQSIADNTIAGMGDLSPADLAMPTLGIWGAQDEVIPNPAPLPGLDQTEVLADAGHMAHMEDTPKVNGLIEAFLEAQD